MVENKRGEKDQHIAQLYLRRVPGNELVASGTSGMKVLHCNKLSYLPGAHYHTCMTNFSQLSYNIISTGHFSSLGFLNHKLILVLLEKQKMRKLWEISSIARYFEQGNA